MKTYRIALIGLVLAVCLFIIISMVSAEQSCEDLIKQKLKRWIALGALGAINEQGKHQRDWNFSFNGTAPFTGYLVKHFPKPIVYVTAGDDVMTGKSLKQSTPEEDNSVWGLATWEDVDPRVDFFSVYIKGLTNAYLSVLEESFSIAAGPARYDAQREAISQARQEHGRGDQLFGLP